MNISAKHVEVLIQCPRVLVVDDNPFMRNLVRGMLANTAPRRSSKPPTASPRLK
jgi:hypothetical protein